MALPNPPHAQTLARLNAMAAELQQLAQREIESGRVRCPASPAAHTTDASLAARIRVENLLRNDARDFGLALDRFGRLVGWLHEVTPSVPVADPPASAAEGAEAMTTAARTLTLARLRESLRFACEALLFADERLPAAASYLWRDPLTGHAQPFAQALADVRSRAEKDPGLRHALKALEAIEEALVREDGWTLTAQKGGVMWRAPDADGTPRTRTEAAALICQRLDAVEG